MQNVEHSGLKFKLENYVNDLYVSEHQNTTSQDGVPLEVTSSTMISCPLATLALRSCQMEARWLCNSLHMFSFVSCWSPRGCNGSKCDIFPGERRTV